MSALAMRPINRVRVLLLTVVLVLMIGLPVSATGGPPRGERVTDSASAHSHQLRGDLRHYHRVRHGHHAVPHRAHPVRVDNAAIL